MFSSLLCTPYRGKSGERSQSIFNFLELVRVGGMLPPGDAPHFERQEEHNWCVAVPMPPRREGAVALFWSIPSVDLVSKAGLINSSSWVFRSAACFDRPVAA